MSDAIRPIAIIAAQVSVAAITGGQSIWIKMAAQMAAVVAVTAAMDLLMPMKLDGVPSPSSVPRVSFAEYGTIIPVALGRVRSNSFFLRYEPDRHWIVIPIIEKVRTGLIGSRKVTRGHRYKTSFEIGFGEFTVSALGRVWSNPNEITIRDSGFTPITADATNVAVKSTEISGTMRLYRGTNTQVNNSNLYPDPVNYKGIAFATFNRLDINSMLTVPSIQCELFSLPVPRNANGTVNSEMYPRGSKNSSHHNYWTANPATALYCILTDPRLGGISPNEMNIGSFVRVSHMLADRSIGISVSIQTATSLRSVLEAILGSVDAYARFDSNNKIEIKLAWDFEDKYNNVKVITDDHYNNLEVQRQSWLEVPNEIQAEWTDTERAYAPNLHIEEVRATPTAKATGVAKLNFQLFTNIETVKRFASYTAYKIGYPSASFKFSLNREEYGDMRVGDTVLLQDSSLMNSNVFFPVTVVEITLPAVDSNHYDVVGREDTNFLITAGNIQGIPSPTNVTPWMGGSDVSHSDFDLSADFSITVDKISPITAINSTIFMSRGALEGIFIMGQRNTLAVAEGDVLVDINNTGMQLIGASSPFAVTGQLLNEYDGPMVDRENYIDVQLTNPSDLFDAWEVDGDSDDIVTLIERDINYMVINGEIMQIGNIEALGPNLYRIRNILRGKFDTPVSSKGIGSTFYFIKNGMDDNYVDVEANDNDNLRIKVYPRLMDVTVDVADEMQLTYKRPRPPAPIFRSVEKVGNQVFLEVRPRFFDKGAGFSDLLDTINSSDYPEIFIEEYSGGSLLRSLVPDQTVVLESSSDADAGRIDVSFTKMSATNNLRVYQNFPRATRSLGLTINV